MGVRVGFRTDARPGPRGSILTAIDRAPGQGHILLMPRWLEIALTLVLFTAGMAVLSWAVNASVPSVHAWLIDHMGHVGFWALFLLLMAVCAVIAWRGHRPTKGSAGNVRGK